MHDPAPSFPGAERLVATVDQAVRHAEAPAEAVDALRKGLCQLIRTRRVDLPDAFTETRTDRYARRELFRSPDLGFSVVAMTWGPGQGTPVHDHCGMWCVEGVWQGELEVVQYELVEREGDRYRFEPVGSVQAGRGSAGSLIPPHEYHTIANPSADDVAVSLHVYSGTMTECSVFDPEGDGWYRRGFRRLSLD